MDLLRAQRFLIPPFFLIIVILINSIISYGFYGVVLSIKCLGITPSILIFFISTYTFGYIIGSTSTSLIHLTDKLKIKLKMKNSFYFKNWKQYYFNNFSEFHKNAYLVLQNDDNIITNSMRDWIVRRWSIVSININSIIGIIFGWLISCSYFHIKINLLWITINWVWITINIILITILYFNASRSRKDILDIEEEFLKKLSIRSLIAEHHLRPR
ncbi:MAG: hypothetical protein M0P70_06965 [Desulfobulbaceae bacterium]|nr:hypothetical protein [Desulfobulbaceae bacterium]